ncbi:hypothetical protein SAMN05421642_107159 [Rhodococcoides kyotonense]|uniref:Excreted virulence factor EspC, type VII ESX diderm n=1 Tax=Rhodococcoides kyotonense TaxID=398843 RepID=A0A239IQ67_9NOCA|nr:hypothetical protein SAMN05421642_107159 [Rhodococcus kyotonensis]
MRDVGDALRSIDVVGAYWSAQSALPGTDLPGLCSEASQCTGSAVHGMSQRMDAVAQSARGSAEDYRVTEDEFAARLRAMSGVR